MIHPALFGVPAVVISSSESQVRLKKFLGRGAHLWLSSVTGCSAALSASVQAEAMVRQG